MRQSDIMNQARAEEYKAGDMSTPGGPTATPGGPDEEYVHDPYAGY